MLVINAGRQRQSVRIPVPMMRLHKMMQETAHNINALSIRRIFFDRECFRDSSDVSAWTVQLLRLSQLDSSSTEPLAKEGSRSKQHSVHFSPHPKSNAARSILIRGAKGSSGLWLQVTAETLNRANASAHVHRTIHELFSCATQIQ